MTSLLRKVVAGPRTPHPEANLDLCYVTDNIIATSGPSATYPSRAYRNPLDQLVKFLDTKHGENWAIWEFRAEGTGYPDEAVHGRIKHFPWPDHHPPPFKLIPGIVGSMKEWVHGEKDPHVSKHAIDTSEEERRRQREGTGKRVIVVHCKAGKGRSGSMACSYLVSQEGWGKTEAIQRFTERRMRPGFGPGVSIPSQLRWLDYVERWTAHGKQYLERVVEIKEVHVYGLREGVKVAVEGFVEEGRKIKTFHVFEKHERDDIGEAMVTESADGIKEAEKDIDQKTDGGDDNLKGTNAGGDANPPKKDDTPSLFGVVNEVMKSQKRSLSIRRSNSKRNSPKSSRSSSSNRSSRVPNATSPTDASSDTLSPTSPNGNLQAPSKTSTASSSSNGSTVKTTNSIFRPTNTITLPTSDINISLERRAKTSYGWAMVTSVAHVWFNAFFEGHGPERMAERHDALHRRGASTDRLADGVPDGPELSGVFEIAWPQMDGIKGSARKGARALDKLQVVWAVKPDVTPEISPVPKPEQQGFTSKEAEAAGDEEHRGRESFESAREELAPLDKKESGVLIKEPEHPGDVRESKAADWHGSTVRKSASDVGSPMARRLGPRPEHHEEGKAGERIEEWKAEREELAKEDQPELDESSDEDGVEGIRRGVRLSVSEGADDKATEKPSKV